jgi:hypothetical protein
MTSRPAAQCLSCKHWRSPLDRTDANARQPEPTQICDAFPKGIPEAIWWNRADHRQPKPGDHGIHWEPDGDAKFPEYAMAPPPKTP